MNGLSIISDMDSRFIFYCADRNGNWFICPDCGAKERFRPKLCPVCQNLKPTTKEELRTMIMMIGKKL